MAIELNLLEQWPWYRLSVSSWPVKN